MPILYACVVNKRRCVIVECNGTRVMGNFAQIVKDKLDGFKEWGKAVIHLTAEQKMVYHDKKSIAVTCICDDYDIKDIEAHRFLDAYE